MGKTRAAKRRAKRAAAKAKVPTAKVHKPKEELCEICAHPFKNLGPDADDKWNIHTRVPVHDWKWRGCKCPDPKWCMGCSRRIILGEAKRCCLDPRCGRIVLPCPWCRVDVNVPDLFHDFINCDL